MTWIPVAALLTAGIPALTASAADHRPSNIPSTMVPATYELSGVQTPVTTSTGMKLGLTIGAETSGSSPQVTFSLSPLSSNPSLPSEMHSWEFSETGAFTPKSTGKAGIVLTKGEINPYGQATLSFGATSHTPARCQQGSGTNFLGVLRGSLTLNTNSTKLVHGRKQPVWGVVTLHNITIGTAQKPVSLLVSNGCVPVIPIQTTQCISGVTWTGPSTISGDTASMLGTGTVRSSTIFADRSVTLQVPKGTAMRSDSIWGAAAGLAFKNDKLVVKASPNGKMFTGSATMTYKGKAPAPTTSACKYKGKKHTQTTVSYFPSTGASVNWTNGSVPLAGHFSFDSPVVLANTSNSGFSFASISVNTFR